MNTFLSYKTIIRLFIAGAILIASLGFASTVNAQAKCAATYTVQRGDYLSKIARDCGVSYSALLKANPSITNPSKIYPGQVLNIPSDSIPVTGSKPGVYTVQQGDTLSSISQKHQISVAELRAANPNLGSTITPGQVLNIPARIRFAAGGTAGNVSGQLGANAQHYYLLNAAANQTLEITLTAPTGVTLAILGADGTTIQSASSTPTFRGVLPKTQDYILVLTSSGSAVDYGLNVAIPTRIRFGTGETSDTLTGTVPANLGQFFILRASQGQTLDVSALPQDKLQLVIYGVDGTVLRSGMGEGASFNGVLPSTQDYILVLRSANQVQDFTLKVTIAATSSQPVSGSYTVQKGDTLLSIAQRHQTTVRVLMRANPEITNQNVIEVGQVIYLPGATLKLSNGKLVYIAKSGDTMGAIAQQFNTTTSNLINANSEISNPNLIFPGQRINIP